MNGNPLSTLRIYRDVKTLRDYYAANIYSKMNVKFRNSVGRMVLEDLFRVVTNLAIVSVSHDPAKKIAALEDILVMWRTVYDKIEFLLTLPNGAGISVKQAGYIFELMGSVEEQDRTLAKAITCQNPQSTE